MNIVEKITEWQQLHVHDRCASQAEVDRSNEELDLVLFAIDKLTESALGVKTEPTIADYIKANEADWKKCHRTMVNIEDLREFKG